MLLTVVMSEQRAFTLILCSDRKEKLIDTKRKQRSASNVTLSRHATSKSGCLRREGTFQFFLPASSANTTMREVSVAQRGGARNQPRPQAEVGLCAGAGHYLGQSSVFGRLASPGARAKDHRALRRRGEISLRPVALR